MNRVPVHSSAVVSIGYEHGIVEVEFSGGRVYHLDGVSQEQFDALLQADSIGRAINSLKAECASCTRVEEEEEA